MDDRAARNEGDVVRSSLAPMAGALVSGWLALSLQRGALVRALVELARISFSVGSTLDAALHVVVTRALPIALAAFSGALVVGLLQTRGTLLGFGAVRYEARRPALLVALAGWAALVVTILDGLRTVLALHAADAPRLAAAATTVVTHSLSVALAVVVVGAAADHLLKSHARTQRLGVDPPAARRAPAVAVDESRAHALVKEATLVLFDDDRVVAIALRAGEPLLWARGRGLEALALRDAARLQSKKLRAASVSSLDDVPLGGVIPVELRAELGLA